MYVVNKFFGKVVGSVKPAFNDNHHRMIAFTIVRNCLEIKLIVRQLHYGRSRVYNACFFAVIALRNCRRLEYFLCGRHFRNALRRLGFVVVEGSSECYAVFIERYVVDVSSVGVGVRVTCALLFNLLLKLFFNFFA